MGKTALVDYGAGNLHSVHNALSAVGADVLVTADPGAIMRADRIVLPGVGAYRTCATGLRRIPGMVEAMEQRVLGDGVPFLGICVGMQLLATRGHEHGETPGLDWIAGDVLPIEHGGADVRVPHMGWNDVTPIGDIAGGLVEEGEAYFLHSYHFVPNDENHVLATTDHGGSLVAAVGRDNILGMQFHPEKSQRYGLAMLERFIAWSP